ncbi:FHA domain-containing protein [Streptomyces sp. NBC_00448]|uniref:FHA domain-containing protein n=1 Tax=Streptomyces sp. NBC_00448 TaxID=2903652 RepID=UPI002E223FA8
MGEETGGGACPECGSGGAHPGQLVCQGCYVPFALMAPVPGADRTDSVGSTDAVGPTDSGETVQPADVSPEPDARPEPEPHPDHTRVIGRLANTEAGNARTRRDGPSRALRLSFPDGQVVEVEPGRQVRLGRERRLCPAVGFLATHDNLSRLHATVRVEPDGSASLTDEGSTNGTYLHGYRLQPHEPAVLNPGDAIRLAADVTVRVLP